MPYLFATRRHIARTYFVTGLLAMGLGTLVEPAYAQLSTGCQNINGDRNRASSHSRPCLLNHHCTWKAGETVLGTMPRPALVMGAVLLILSVLSSPSFAAADCNWMTVRNSVATSVWASGPAPSSDGRDTGEANTSQVAELI
jgi:hypothetical protein